MFPSADFFIAMVRDKYAPVYRHRSVEFGAAHDDGDLVTQVLTIVDGDNQVWKALYELRAPARRDVADHRLRADPLDRHVDLRRTAPRIFLDLLRCIIHEDATTPIVVDARRLREGL